MRNVSLQEEDRATAVGNMHRKFVKIGRVVAETWSWTDKHTDTPRGRSNYQQSARDTFQHDTKAKPVMHANL